MQNNTAHLNEVVHICWW